MGRWMEKFSVALSGHLRIKLATMVGHFLYDHDCDFEKMYIYGLTSCLLLKLSDANHTKKSCMSRYTAQTGYHAKLESLH